MYDNGSGSVFLSSVLLFVGNLTVRDGDVGWEEMKVESEDDGPTIAAVIDDRPETLRKKQDGWKTTFRSKNDDSPKRNRKRNNDSSPRRKRNDSSDESPQRRKGRPRADDLRR